MRPRRAPRVLVAGAVLGQPMGGVRRHNDELLPRASERLCAAGGRLAILAGRVPPRLASLERLEVLPGDVPAAPPLRRAWREGSALRLALERAAEEGRPFDLVHTAHLPAPRIPVPFTLTLHDLRKLERGVLRPLWRAVVADAVRRAAAVCAVSETVRSRIEGELEPRQTRLVRNGSDHLAALPRQPSPSPFLLHVGHLEPRKNLELLLRALACDASLPELRLYGRAKGRHGERLRALARRLGVDGRVSFGGPVEDAELPALYATCTCCVLPSRLEGFGIGALEAQAARAPLAIARAGALPEVAGPEVPSFSPDDPVECARAIRAAIDLSPAVLAGLAERAAGFRWDASAEALCSVWREVSEDPYGR